MSLNKELNSSFDSKRKRVSTLQNCDISHEKTEQLFFSFRMEISLHLLAVPVISWFTGATELQGRSTSFWKLPKHFRTRKTTISGLPNSVEKSFGNAAFWKKATAFATVSPAMAMPSFISTKWREWRNICIALRNLPNSALTMATTTVGSPTGPSHSSKASPEPSISSATSWIRPEQDFRHSIFNCSNLNSGKCLATLTNWKLAYLSLLCDLTLPL